MWVPSAYGARTKVDGRTVVAYFNPNPQAQSLYLASLHKERQNYQENASMNLKGAQVAEIMPPREASMSELIEAGSSSWG